MKIEVYRAAELLEKAAEGYEKLPAIAKMQAAGVLLPLIGSVRALLDEVEKLKGEKNGNEGI
ncbi:MAG: hypothetical protein EPO42_13300 [Gallionellaceae bacterium]|nr:MAG: hypothetical protein EPO42_13300 [Gallionellaceae bacterium]